MLRLDAFKRGRSAQATALARAESIIATLEHPFLLVLDKELRVVTANRSFYETFKVSKEETERRLVQDLGNRQWDIPTLRTLLEEVVGRDYVLKDFEVEHDFPTIGSRIMQLSARRIDRVSESDPGDERILVTIEDVTDRRRLEKSVTGSEQRYRRLFESAKDGILILDAKTGRIVDANPFITRLLGMSHADVMGKQLWQIGLFRDIDANKAAVQQLQDRGYIRYEDLPLESTTGARIDVEFVSNVYQEGAGSVIQCNIRDITERKQIQDMLQQQASALAEASRSKDEFLAMLSHELRTPLGPILAAVQLLRLPQGDQTLQQEARDILERQVKHLSRLVDDLLEVSRIAAGKVTLHKERIGVAGVVERAVQTARPFVSQQQHELSISLPDQPIWLYADSTRLEQVVTNLLINSAKYTRPGGRIWLTVMQEGDEMVLRVRDTGVGIAAELLPRMFDLFAQADRTLARSQGGLGVGLALVRHLVELHRGRVEAHSAGLDQGSEFVVSLPVMMSAAPFPAPSVETTRPIGGSLRLLVVDDNRDAANSSAALLRTVGHEVHLAHTGPEAVETALAVRPDVVLLDIGLPQMDGYEVARRLREHSELQEVGLVAITGYGQESDRERSREAGFDHHLVKPADWVRLQEVLAALGRGQSESRVQNC